MTKNFFLAEYMTMIASRLSLPLRIVAFLILALATTEVVAQNCNCPKPTNCVSCTGGFTTFTLKYNGLLNGIVTIYDGGGLIKATTVSRGDIIGPFSGTIPNEKFVGPTVNVFFDGLPAATFYTTCTTQYPGDVSGVFEIVSIVSKGGAVCCLPAAVDTEKPKFTYCPSDVSENLPPTSCTKTVHWTEPTVTDDCKFKLKSTHKPDLTLFSVGTTIVTYTATDSIGNVETCTFKVTINDVTPPVFANCPTTVTRTADETCKAKGNWTPPTTTDNNCNSPIEIKVNHTPDETFPIGSTQIKYEAIDSKGNKSTCIFNVIVEDKTPPVFVMCPEVITATVDNSCMAKIKLPELQATDNCSDAAVTSSHPGELELPLGETIITYKAVDKAANSVTCSAKVIVSNALNPEIKGCPGTITENTTATEPDSVAVTWEEPEATVACGEVHLFEQSHKPGSKFPVGKTTVIYTFKDDVEKTSTCTFDVVIFSSDQPFEISKVVTPDGDGINDVWMLSNIEDFKSNTVVVVDRWGNKIYQATGYDNVRTVWNGTNKNGTVVPTGTYFYTIEVRDQDKVTLKKGFIEVIQ
jgi:gliding motility-associated-like protein